MIPIYMISPRPLPEDDSNLSLLTKINGIWVKKVSEHEGSSIVSMLPYCFLDPENALSWIQELKASKFHPILRAIEDPQYHLKRARAYVMPHNRRPHSVRPGVSGIQWYFLHCEDGDLSYYVRRLYNGPSDRHYETCDGHFGGLRSAAYFKDPEEAEKGSDSIYKVMKKKGRIVDDSYSLPPARLRNIFGSSKPSEMFLSSLSIVDIEL